MGGLDVLRVGERPPARHRRWIWALVVALLVLGLVLRWVDATMARREYDALTRAWTTAQGHAGHADRVVASIIDYASPHLQTATAEVRAGLRELVEDAAAAQVPVMRAAWSAVTAVDVLPWHGALRAARSACAAYLAGRVERLEAVALNALAFGRPHVAFDVELAEAWAQLQAAAP